MTAGFGTENLTQSSLRMMLRLGKGPRPGSASSCHPAALPSYSVSLEQVAIVEKLQSGPWLIPAVVGVAALPAK